MNYYKELNVGLILSCLDSKSAYFGGPPMNRNEEHMARCELREGLSQLKRNKDKPEIILAPELAAPRGFINELGKHVCNLGAICIFGVDYLLDYLRSEVMNEILVMIPDRWPRKKYNRRVYTIPIYKTHMPKKENKLLNDSGWRSVLDSKLWIFDAGPYGIFGIANCYEVLDIERHLLYRSKIQHLFVLSYNRDITSFMHSAESLCRTLFCNVIVCNTGFYGGSVCVSPYRKPYQRTIYRKEGSNLFSTQVIKLPIKALIDQQNKNVEGSEFKHVPPGF